MAGILGTHTLAQVGFIVKDIEASKQKWAEFLGIEAPPTVDGGKYEITRTMYLGEPAPDANCFMAFLKCGPGDLEIELIQPNEHPSTWRDFLEKHGEGIHHLAFKVTDSRQKVEAAQAFGLQHVQFGLYNDGSCEYHYLEAPELKRLIETLESYPG